MPNPLHAPAEFANSVLSISRRVAADVILPVTDSSLLAILPERDRFKPSCVPFPDIDVYRRISNKALLLETAARLGIAVPSQFVLSEKSHLAELAHTLRFPSVIKPSRSIVESEGVRLKTVVRHADGLAALQAQVHDMPDAVFPLLIQQRIVGPGIGVFLLRWHGEIVAQFAHRRIREKPPAGGVSVYRESVTADPALVKKSAELLEAFDWTGPAMIEYKVDRATGTPYLMEINGRLWGSLQLAIDAGVNFPLILALLAHGEPVTPVRTYKLGVRSRWWWGDLDHLLARWRKSKRQLALADDAPSRLRATLDFFMLWRPGDRNEVFRIGDPWPAVRETAAWFRGE